MMAPRVLALDPGLSNFGWCIADVSGSLPKILAAGVFSTDKATKKQQAMVADDNQRRIAELTRHVWKLLSPKYGVRGVIAEAMSFIRHPGGISVVGSVQLMTSIAVYTSLATVRDLPITILSPKDVKAGVGADISTLPKPEKFPKGYTPTKDEKRAQNKAKEERKEASKRLVQARILTILKPQRATIMKFAEALGDEDKWEHMFDSIGVIVAGMNSMMVRTLRQGMVRK